MKVLLVGVGSVGEGIAVIARPRPWVEQIVLADYNLERAKQVQARLAEGGGVGYNGVGYNGVDYNGLETERFPVEWVDASRQDQVESLAKKYRVDLIMNACDPSFVPPIFQAAYQTGCTYMDLAMSLSQPHPDEPYRQAGVKLGDLQLERADEWERKGLLALVGMGVEPGMSDVFARYAQDCLFDEIEEIGVRDGSDLQVQGYAFAPTFSIWTTIEECLNPPLIWERERGWYTTEPFSEPEVFEFPEGIGAITCVNVEHEEVVLVPRWIHCQRVTFKYALGDQFIEVLKTLKMLGLDRKEPIQVKGVQVAPRDVVAACLPDPAHLGERMTGRTCAGTWVKGTRDGQPRQVYLYQVADNQVCMQTLGIQAVAAQTAFNPVIAWDLLNSGAWQGKGVLGPEAFDPLPFMNKMAEYGFPYGIKELGE
jgi:saccharopine dehydrogenase-like NADP-dependent oxidoreductase